MENAKDGLTALEFKYPAHLRLDQAHHAILTTGLETGNRRVHFERHRAFPLHAEL